VASVKNFQLCEQNRGSARVHDGLSISIDADSGFCYCYFFVAVEDFLWLENKDGGVQVERKMESFGVKNTIL